MDGKSPALGLSIGFSGGSSLSLGMKRGMILRRVGREDRFRCPEDGAEQSLS